MFCLGLVACDTEPTNSDLHSSASDTADTETEGPPTEATDSSNAQPAWTIEEEFAEASSPSAAGIPHPPRHCYYSAQCASHCGCENNRCVPHGVSPLPPQSYCDYPPEFYTGDVQYCSGDDECADNCRCLPWGYCKHFGMPGPLPPLSTCAPPPAGPGGGGGGPGGDGPGGPAVAK